MTIEEQKINASIYAFIYISFRKCLRNNQNTKCLLQLTSKRHQTRLLAVSMYVFPFDYTNNVFMQIHCLQWLILNHVLRGRPCLVGWRLSSVSWSTTNKGTKLSMSYVLRHNLPGVSLVHLLKIFNKHFPGTCNHISILHDNSQQPDNMEIRNPGFTIQHVETTMGKIIQVSYNVVNVIQLLIQRTVSKMGVSF